MAGRGGVDPMMDASLGDRCERDARDSELSGGM